MKKTVDELMEGRQIRRMKAEDRYLDKVDQQVKDAEPMIGELCREGKTMYYVYPLGGKYKESNSHAELVVYLARNRYI